MGGGTGEQQADMPEHDVDYSGGGSVVNSGANSNFDSTPQMSQKKIVSTSKPVFALKKSQIKKGGADPLM